MEENLSAAEQEVKGWKLRYKGLERKKEKFTREIIDALRRKENEMGQKVKTAEDKFRKNAENNKELSEYIQKLQKKTVCFFLPRENYRQIRKKDNNQED